MCRLFFLLPLAILLGGCGIFGKLEEAERRHRNETLLADFASRIAAYRCAATQDPNCYRSAVYSAQILIEQLDQSPVNGPVVPGPMR